ncbi:hypothetical protein H5300_24705 [Vibrio sp. SG41-7]|nr:hypothetical protein [Vibrio sp. SG41-7]
MKLPTHIVDIRENIHTDKITWREALQALQEATKRRNLGIEKSGNWSEIV